VGLLRRLGAAVALGVVLAGGTACGERSEPTGAGVSPYPLTVQGAGDRPTTLDRRPERIAALDPAVATMLIELDAQKQLVGLPGSGGPSIWRLTGSPLVRALVRLRPDLVVASSATDPVDLSHAQKETGAATYLVPEDSLRDIDRAVTQLGLLTNHAVPARRFVLANDRAERRVVQAVADKPVLRVFVDTGGFITVSTRTLVSDLIRIGGGRNVVGPRPEPGVFSLKKLAGLDPQVYLTSDARTTLRYLRKNPKTRRLTAVRTGRVAHISPRFLRPDGDLSDRILAISRLLHPDAFH
jgi:ABC-type Fe3+-hydroxamate transport system substrate-binding protein